MAKSSKCSLKGCIVLALHRPGHGGHRWLDHNLVSRVHELSFLEDLKAPRPPMPQHEIVTEMPLIGRPRILGALRPYIPQYKLALGEPLVEWDY
ncbi:hypothetical protein PanWU01x14_078740 [Parasponia andersonii]|uniref:Uncharacterized protein n=1 Tax=Parasponia andersonii TaxID=3476 RepID=A0A2P5DC34_PARAD|nr:hypothetical protein PanWU01x14_078740 [Parasponia andersonii]